VNKNEYISLQLVDSIKSLNGTWCFNISTHSMSSMQSPTVTTCAVTLRTFLKFTYLPTYVPHKNLADSTYHGWAQSHVYWLPGIVHTMAFTSKPLAQAFLAWLWTSIKHFDYWVIVTDASILLASGYYLCARDK